MQPKLHDKESTNSSKKELITFINFCKQKFKYSPAIIGGWAVYSYAKKEQSIDIDVVFGSNKESQKVMNKFFKENNYEEEEWHDQQKHFVKKIVTKQTTAEIRFDYYSYEDQNKLLENTSITIPYSLIKNNFDHKKIGTTKMRVPSIELLLLYKVKALRDRNTKLNVKGIRILKEQQLWLKSKMAKDKRDINELINTGKINQEKLEKLLKQTKFKNYFNQTLKELKLE